jgi:hypothetical protein
MFSTQDQPSTYTFEPLDVFSLSGRHTGQNLAEALAASLHGWGIHDRVLSIIADNASSNDVMVKKICELDWERFGENQGQVRCFAHVLNLIVGVSGCIHVSDCMNIC